MYFLKNLMIFFFYNKIVIYGFRVHLNSTIQRKDQPLIVFGIPTVSRSKTEYLNQTMKSLLSHLSPQEKSECLFVIMVAEIIQNKAIDLVKRINKTYR